MAEQTNEVVEYDEQEYDDLIKGEKIKGFLANRCRAVAFTVFNYDDDTKNRLTQLKTDYLCFSDEVCPTTGRKHLQAYLYAKDKITLNVLHKACNKNCKIFMAKGTSLQNRVYIRGDYAKNGKFKPINDTFVEYGVLPVQGSRTDLDEVKLALKKNYKMRDVLDVATSYQSMKLAENMLKYYEPKRKVRTKVYWYFGASGRGKDYEATRKANELVGEDDVYRTFSTGKWWDGYDAHKAVIISDMRLDFMKFHEFLKLFDENGFIIETKGGSRQMRAEHIFITSCQSPTELFENQTDEKMEQITSRLSEVCEFKGSNRRLEQTKCLFKTFYEGIEKVD